MKDLTQKRFILLLLFCFVFAGRVHADGHVTGSLKAYKNLNVTLDNLIKKYKENKPEALTAAAERKIIDKENRVKVIFYPENGLSSGVNLNVLDKYDIKYRISKSFIYAEIPIENLETVTLELKNVRYINVPAKIYKVAVTTTSQGVAAINANRYIQNGYQGQGVKIAVIDIDFMNYLELSGTGELPQSVNIKNYTQENMNDGTDGHGTACAEIVYDLAPQAQLYLIKIDNTVDLENAKDYCAKNSIKVISMSLGWNSDNFCDGTGDVCRIVNQMRDNGIFFAQAAGNHAKVHWTGAFIDSSTYQSSGIYIATTTYCQFSTNNTEKLKINSTGPGNMLSINLIWDAFPLTNENFDLYLYNDQDHQVDSSTDIQQNDVPFESIDYRIPNPSGGIASSYYYIMVKKINAQHAHTIRIFIDSASSFVNPADSVPSMSLLTPADSTGAFATGAILYSSYTTGPQESFSSQGPTFDGRIKPDIAAPDGVSTVSFGINNSFGTSFASPHVAGAAAILLSLNNNLTAGEIEQKLASTAIDMGTSGKDNIYGYGRLNMPPLAPSGVTAKALSTTQIEWRWSTGTYTNMGIIGYKIYASNGDIIKIVLGAGTSFWIEANLSTNTFYSRSIKAYSALSQGDPAGISKYTLTSDPYGLSVSTFGMHFIDIAWFGEKNSFFCIDRSTDNLSWSVIVSSSAKLNNLLYIDNYLEFSTTYYYRIAAYNGDGIISKNYTFISKKTQGLPSNFLILLSTSTLTQEQTATNPGVGDVKIDIPPGALNQNDYIIIDTNAGNNPNEVSKTDLDNATAKLTATMGKIVNGSIVRLNMYRTNGSTVTGNFAKPLQLTMAYPDSNNDGKVDNMAFHNEVELLKIVTLNATSLVWETLSGSTLDKANKVMSSDINHFSIYALAIILTPGNDLSGVLVYPSPYKPGSTGLYGDSSLGKGIVFEKLTKNADIKIFNIAGEMVKEINGSQINPSGVYVWDTKNDYNNYVASGVYIYYITNPDDASQKKYGKFAIIK